MAGKRIEQSNDPEILSWGRAEWEKSQDYLTRETLGVRMQIERPGKIPVNVILHRPAIADADIPLVVNMHGGGLITGDAVTLETLCRFFMERLPAVVVNVNYHKADEVTVREMVDEVADTVRFFCEHSDTYSIDTRHIVLMGESSGGHLVAGAALLLRDTEINPCCQVLVYPTTDVLRDIPNALVQKVIDFLFPTTEEMDIYSAPRIATDDQLSGVCPAIFIECRNDRIRPMGVEYAKRLAQVGTPVLTKEYTQALHGFLEVCRPDYNEPDERKTDLQTHYRVECEEYLIDAVHLFLKHRDDPCDTFQHRSDSKCPPFPRSEKP